MDGVTTAVVGSGLALVLVAMVVTARTADGWYQRSVATVFLALACVVIMGGALAGHNLRTALVWMIIFLAVSFAGLWCRLRAAQTLWFENRSGHPRPGGPPPESEAP